MMRNLVTSLFAHESIRTTDVKAKEGRRLAERLIAYGKDGSLAKRRLAAAYISDKAVLKKLFDDIAKRFVDRQGGCTRIVKLGNRLGDNASLSLLELTEKQVVVEEKTKGKGKEKSGEKEKPKRKAKSEAGTARGKKKEKKPKEAK